MPAIIVNSLEMTQEQKRIIAEKFITTFSEVRNVPKDRVYLFFDGYTLDNAAVGGKLFSDMPHGSIKAHGAFNREEWETSNK